MPADSRTTNSLRTVPMYQMLVVYGVYGLIAWLNVRFVFDWVDANLHGSAIQRLIGSYLPHAVFLVVVVGLLIILWGRLRAQDLGFQAGGWRIGLTASLLFWLSVNLLFLLQEWQSGREYRWNPAFVSGDWFRLLVDLIVTQVVGNALLEEVVFRGYFFQQLKLRLIGNRHSHSRKRQWLGSLAAGVLSVGLFVALHLPIRLDAGIFGSELVANLLRVAVWGALFTVMFAWTRNLWLVIGIHAIVNRPCMLIESDNSTRLVQMATALLFAMVIIGWSLTRRWAATRIPDLRD